MTFADLKNKINKITVWKKGDQRAPHKPLLILYALGELQTRNQLTIPYADVKDRLKQLLIDFGPKRSSYHPEEPFVRLEKDGIWKLNQPVLTKDIRPKFLIEHQVVGTFPEEVKSVLQKDKGRIKEIAEIILNSHFPETMHEDILSAVGLTFESGKRIRDPQFRDRILRAYGYQCCICGFNVRLGSSLVAVEAAHIKWHQYKGPDTEENGIALCSMHHKLFDRGVFTIDQELKVLVSEDAYGNNGFDEWLMRFHGREIAAPIRPRYKPHDDFISWHVREVFKGSGRYFQED